MLVVCVMRFDALLQLSPITTTEHVLNNRAMVGYSDSDNEPPLALAC